MADHQTQASASSGIRGRKDRPLIFSAPMVKALLEGRKRMTRRVLKHRDPDLQSIVQQAPCANATNGWATFDHPRGGPGTCIRLPCAVGDRLWVREAHYLTDDGDNEYAVFACEADDVREHLANMAKLSANFPEDVKARHLRLRPAMHLPRWASRLTLIVESVKVERLQDISEEDAVAEGAVPYVCAASKLDTHPSGHAALGCDHRAGFWRIWTDIHGPDAWTDNPWVAAISFRAIPQNIDSLGDAP